MSGCAHARMGILGPHPSPECEDARPSLPALRSGWAITYSQRTRPRINNQHTTTAWRVSIALYFTSFSHPGRAAGRAAEAARRRRFWHLGPRARFHPARLARCNSHVRFSHRLISHISYAYRVESHIIVNIA